MHPFLRLLPRCPACPQQGAGLRPGCVHLLCTPILDILFSRDQIPNTLTPKPQETEIWICSSFSSSISRNFSFASIYIRTNYCNFSFLPSEHFSKQRKLHESVFVELLWFPQHPNLNQTQTSHLPMFGFKIAEAGAPCGPCGHKPGETKHKQCSLRCSYWTLEGVLEIGNISIA